MLIYKYFKLFLIRLDLERVLYPVEVTVRLETTNVLFGLSPLLTWSKFLSPAKKCTICLSSDVNVDGNVYESVIWSKISWTLILKASISVDFFCFFFLIAGIFNLVNSLEEASLAHFTKLLITDV